MNWLQILSRRSGSNVQMNTRKAFHWWYAVLIFILANLASAIPVGFGGDFAFFDSFLKPSVAPPGWAFAPVWLILNVTSLIAMYRIANSGPQSRHRTIFLVSEGLGWVLFASFATLYFLLRSPILGAIDTVTGLLVGLVSLVYAIRMDRQAAGYILLRCCGLRLRVTYRSIWPSITQIHSWVRQRCCVKVPPIPSRVPLLSYAPDTNGGGL